MPAQSDPRPLSTRRHFLGRGATAAAALALGPSMLAACGSGSPGPTAARTVAPDDGAPASGHVRISNWPSYMAPGFIADFEKSSGLTVSYTEDFNDNEAWFAKVKEPLSKGQDIGADVVVPTEFMALRLKGLNWLNEIRDARVPNKKNLRPDLLHSAADPGRRFTAPYMSGMVGIAYNQAATGRPVTTVDDLWDPAFKGRVSLMSDMQDAVGMVMLAQGNSVSDPTLDTVRQAVDAIREQKDRGQIRKFTGNDYIGDMATGNTIVAQAYSGDVVQMQADNPDIRFVLPESGGNWFIDTMVIPYTTQNQKGAEAWIDYLYDRRNYAKLIAYTQYVPVLSDMLDELDKIDPKLAANPLIYPSQAVLDNLKTWGALSEEQMKSFVDAYAVVTGG